MQIKPYTSINSSKLAPVYPFDVATSLANQDFYTDEQVYFNFSPALSAIADTKINNFSQLFLSKKKKISDFLSIKPLTLENTGSLQTFSTFLAFRSLQGINSQSLYWAATDTVSLSDNTSTLYIETVNGALQNRHFFDIKLLDQLLCKVSHQVNGQIRYLTLDYSYSLNLCLDAGLSQLGGDDPQTFYYVQDATSGLFFLYKKIRDYPYYITYTTVDNRCGLVQPPLGPYFAFNTNGSIKLRPYTAPYSSFPITETEASYAKDTLNNSLNTTTSSRNNITNNFLINTEFYNITGNSLPINILTLKNELAPDNNNIQKTDYFVTDQFDTRQYNKIFSGTNQSLGDDSIAISYDGYTHLLNFKADKITYFHAPYDLYPYNQLNINDTTLVSVGAIAGDHPVKADKIFKKQAIYGNYNGYGSTSDEANGTFLCAWLSGSTNPNIKPVWMDRYYNPSVLSPAEALQFFNNTNYITNFDNLNITTPLNAVFDKPSDLYFEPGAYYAYHHLGSNDISNYLLTLDTSAVQKGFTNFYVNNSLVNEIPTELNEFSFNGQQYSICSSLSSAILNNKFTLSFDLNAADWQSSFGNQIVGNYITDGFGVFIDRYITPFLYYYSGNSLYIYNSVGTLLHTIVFQKNIRAVWRQHELNSYYVLFLDGSVINNNINNTTINASSASPYIFDNIVSSFYSSSGATIVGNLSGYKKVLYYNFSSNNFTDITSNLTTLNNIPLSTVNTVVRYRNNYYGLSAFEPLINSGNLYYQNGDFEIRNWSLSANIDYPYFTTSKPIRHFNIDRNSNFWILCDDIVYEYSSQRLPIYSFTIDNPNRVSKYINFGHEIIPSGELYYALITSQNVTSAADGTLNVKKYDYQGNYLHEFQTINSFNNQLFDQNITGDHYYRTSILNSNYEKTLNVRVILSNVINLGNTTFNLSYPLSSIGVGYHTITTRIDNIKGTLDLFVDGVNVNSIYNTPGQYVLDNTLKRPLLVGATSFFDNTTLPQYIKQPAFYINNCKIKNFTLYNQALNDFDIKLLSSQNQPSSDLKYNMPCGKREYIDEIERVFKMDVPIKKSSNFNIKLINLGNVSQDLKAALEDVIRQQISDKLPYNASVQNIKWIN